MATTLNVVANISADGVRVFEEVLVEETEGGEYVLLRSPGLTPGMAAGDQFLLNPDQTTRVTHRGRNVCVQIFAAARIDLIETDFAPEFARLGGRLDGKAPKELVYTIPVTAGFRSIEHVLENMLTRYPDAEWYYGNVYDPEDGETPLNWWVE
ncbi:MAG: DUF4265 domain-containing protein [Deltaproteobacteria bacterium]|nr:DUF4265 domain-containing protein [Deltaproteobacteria bacterium]